MNTMCWITEYEMNELQFGMIKEWKERIDIEV